MSNEAGDPNARAIMEDNQQFETSLDKLTKASQEEARTYRRKGVTTTTTTQQCISNDENASSAANSTRVVIPEKTQSIIDDDPSAFELSTSGVNNCTEYDSADDEDETRLEETEMEMEPETVPLQSQVLKLGDNVDKAAGHGIGEEQGIDGEQEGETNVDADTFQDAQMEEEEEMRTGGIATDQTAPPKDETGVSSEEEGDNKEATEREYPQDEEEDGEKRDEEEAKKLGEDKVSESDETPAEPDLRSAVRAIVDAAAKSKTVSTLSLSRVRAKLQERGFANGDLKDETVEMVTEEIGRVVCEKTRVVVRAHHAASSLDQLTRRVVKGEVAELLGGLDLTPYGEGLKATIVDELQQLEQHEEGGGGGRRARAGAGAGGGNGDGGRRRRRRGTGGAARGRR